MHPSQSNTIDKQFRKAAILLASLEDDMAEQLLAGMPSTEVEQVRLALQELEDVEADEQDDILAEFHRSRQQPASVPTEGVELDPSLLARFEQPDDGVYNPQQKVNQTGLDSLSDTEAETIVEILIKEHPQTIALVISRLTHQAAGKLVSLLSADLRHDVLDRVAQLDPAEESSAEIVEAHLSCWIREHRQKSQRIAAGTELVQKILENTPRHESNIVEGRICREHPRPTGAFGKIEPTPQPADRNIVRTYKKKRYIPYPPSKTSESETAAKYRDIDTDDPLQILETTDDATLTTALTNLDTSIVTLALAGASEKVMSRVLSRLPRRQAKRLQSQLRTIAATRLGDMFDAQMQLAKYVKDQQVQAVTR